MATDRITFDDERSESIRKAFEELAEKAETLTDSETVRANKMERERDEAIEERDTLRATIADLERRLAVEKASWQRVYDLDVGRLKARVAELEARAEEARNDIIAELIDGVAEIGCIYGGDVKEPQITGREEVVAGLEKLREILGGGR